MSAITDITTRVQNLSGQVDTANGKIAQVSTKVDELIAAGGTTDPAEVDALAQQVTVLEEGLGAASTALDTILQKGAPLTSRKK